MSREIKFRAWDSVKRNMMFIGEFPIYHELDNGLHSGLTGENGDWDSHKLMQFTGLKDKNGVDIYEGDILKSVSKVIRPFATNKKDMYPDKIATRYNCVEYRGEKGAFCWVDSALTGLNQNTISKYSEIVGNIYETPELLK